MTVKLDVASKSANATITADVTLGATNNAHNGARADTIRTTGKLWFEIDCTGITVGSADGCGVEEDATPNYTNLGADASRGVIVYRSGQVFFNGSLVFTIPGITGQVVMYLLDLDNSLLWVRTPTGSPSGWNGSGTADPCAGTGGLNILAINGAGLYPVGVLASLANSMTFNFGAGAAVNTPPPCFSPWSTTPSPPPPTPTLHLLGNAHLPVYRQTFTGLSAGAPLHMTMAATEPSDVMAGGFTMSVADAMTLAATEPSDTFASTMEVNDTPPELDDAERIYVLQEAKTNTIRISWSPEDLRFVIPSEATLLAIPSVDQ